MIGNDAGIVEDEEFFSDWRPGAPRHCEYERQHQDMQDRLEKRPAISELRIAEPSPGLTDDQSVDETQLGSQGLQKAGRWPRRSGRPQRALAQNHVIAIQCFEAAVQYLKHRLDVFLIFRSDSDQFSANGERFGKPATVEINGELRTPRDGVRRIEHRGPAERFRRLVKPSDAVEKVRPVQMVFDDLRREGERPIDSVERVLDPPTQHLRRRKEAKCNVIPRMNVDGVENDIGRLVKPPGSEQELGRMQCIGTITRRQRRGAQGGSDGLVASFKGELEGGQMPQRGTVVRCDACGAREIFDGVLVQAGRLEQTGRMESKFKRIRIEVARRPTVEGRTIDLSCGGERAARMAMPLGPLRTKFQQSLVCRRGFVVSAAIAEYPGA